MSAGNPEYSEMELIATAIVGSAGVASISFDVSSVGSSFRHLQLRASVRTANNTSSSFRLQFNSDTATNYGAHIFYADGSIVGSAYFGALNIITTINTVVTSNSFSCAIVDILDAFSSSKLKTTRGLSASANEINLSSNLWRNTAPITSINCFIESVNIGPGTRVSLYGIKG
jgi:hypothetical protein